MFKKNTILLFLLVFIFFIIQHFFIRLSNRQPAEMNRHNQETATEGERITQPGESHREVEKIKSFEIITTAYSEFDSCHFDGCLTASGKPAYVGGVACNFLPFGTKIEIDGVIYTVEDRHSKRLNDRLDIFMGYGQEAYNKAINYGKQIKKVRILE